MPRPTFQPLSALLLAATVCLALGCKDRTRFPPSAWPNAGRRSAQPVDRVRCEFYFRGAAEVTPDTDTPALESKKEVIEVGPDEEKRVALKSMTLSASYSDAQFDSPSLHVRVEAGDTQLFGALYQLRDGRLPLNQFVGGHGFTGLIYLVNPSESGDYQLFCKSVRKLTADSVLPPRP